MDNFGGASGAVALVLDRTRRRRLDSYPARAGSGRVGHQPLNGSPHGLSAS